MHATLSPERLEHLRRYMALVTPTFYEAWPQALRRLSFASTLVRLTAEERDLMLDAWGGEDEGARAAFDKLGPLAERLDDPIGRFPAGAFVKLGSRSPKDVGDPSPILSGRQALGRLLLSERVFEDLLNAHHTDYLPCVVVREFDTRLAMAEEWRAFVRGGKVRAVSQYDYWHFQAGLAEKLPSIQFAFGQFWKDLRPALHLEDVVVDLWVHEGPTRAVGGIQETAWHVRLVELNPWGPWTDPCLCQWEEGAFEQERPEWRILSQPGGHQSVFE